MLGHVKDPLIGHIELGRQLESLCAAIVHESGLFAVQFLIFPTTGEVP